MNPSDAEDATQSFFVSILAKGTLSAACAEKGRLRTFLLTAFQRWLIDFDAHRHALKRGGGQQIVSLDQAWAEDEISCEPADPRSPEDEFNRRWALTVLDAAIADVEKIWSEQGKSAQFEAMRPFLGFTAAGEDSYPAVAEVLELSEGALRVAVHRLRKEFRDALFAAIGETLEEPSEENLRNEVRALLDALAA